jgi:hypothetical protein
MSSSKRQPSKQKRASQNKAQRTALQQRKVAASAEPVASSSSRSTSSGGGGGSLFGRLRGSMATPTPARGGGAGTARPARGAAAGSDQPIGYRPALVGLLAAGASLILCLVAIRVPVDRDGEIYTPERLAAEWTSSAVEVAQTNPDLTAKEVADDVETWTPDRHKDLIAKAVWPLSLALILPIIGAYFGFRAVAKRRPGKVVNRAMFATLLGAFLTQGLFLLFLPSVIGLGIASFQIRRAEMAALAESAANDPDRVVPADDDVIDAEVIEDAEVVEAEVVDVEVVEDDDPTQR